MGNHKLWSQTQEPKGVCAMFHQDPFELAIEEASMKLLHSVRNVFQAGKTAVCPPIHAKEPHMKLEERLCNLARRQCAQRPVHVVSNQFASASFMFVPMSNHRREGDAKECSQRSADERGNGFANTSSSCICQGARVQPEGSRELLHECPNWSPISPLDRDDTANGKMQKGHRSSKQLAMASLTFAHQQDEDARQEINHPSSQQLLSHPLALLSYIPKDVSLFVAGAVAGATAKTVTAPLDRIKLLMQVHGVKATQAITKKSIGFVEAAVKIGKEEGIQGYWKGNLPQVIRVIPYSAVQLLSYELYKKLFKGTDKDLSVVGRLAAGACAGMTSTLVTYPLDVLRLRLAVDPACKSMVQVATTMLREEGLSSFYRGLGPSLLGIAPYIALNFCAFDLIKKSLPDEIKKTPAASFLTAFLSASLATTMCYPLDTVRRQLQMKGTPYVTVLDAIPGIITNDGVLGLYRGFVPNALKNLPNSSIRLTTFDAAKNLINASQLEFQRLLKLRRGVSNVVTDLPSAKES